jgi:hypothetical protein
VKTAPVNEKAGRAGGRHTNRKSGRYLFSPGEPRAGNGGGNVRDRAAGRERAGTPGPAPGSSVIVTGNVYFCALICFAAKPAPELEMKRNAPGGTEYARELLGNHQEKMTASTD